MSELTPELACALLEMCRGGADEAADALGRALDGKFSVVVGEATPLAGDMGAIDGAGLALLFHVGAEGLAIVLPESSGLLPTWTRTPDATGASKLATLAQELGMLMLPEALPVGETQASHTPDLRAALARGGVGDDATQITLTISAGEQRGSLRVIWPLRTPQQFVAPSAETAAAEPEMPPEAPRVAPWQKSAARSGQSPDFSVLPGYSRSLLKIRVPVSVQLATKKETLQEVISLGQGSIIKFEKGCEQLLQLFVGKHAVAEGEAVKVGEKFGFRVTAMLLPPEHFVAVKRPKSA